MTYNRMEAKPIPGEYCRFCGDDSSPLVKTKCCGQWICCDTEFVSFRGGDYCQFEHEHYSLCHFHYNEKHQGSWKTCKECREFVGEKEFAMELSRDQNRSNYFP